MNCWKDNVKKVVPYTPGEQPQIKNVVKINTNENPYPPSPKVYEAMKNFDADNLKKYPDPLIGKLIEAIAEYHNIDKDMVFAGVGSDDVLGMAFLTFFNGDKPILFPDITYSFYDVWADLFGIKYEQIPLLEDFTIRKEDYIRENGGIIIANPNAPTSIALDIDDIEYIIKNNPSSVVIIDEAYIDFGGVSALGLVNKYDNLLVVRTFSKSRSMAGARIGYAVGCKDIIKYLNDVKYSYNSYTLSNLTIDLGVASIKDDEYFRNTVDKIIETREKYSAELKKLGFTVLDSSSNFLFAKPSGINAYDLFEELKRRNIFVRYFNKQRINEYLRISVGTDKEMQILIDNIKDIIG